MSVEVADKISMMGAPCELPDYHLDLTLSSPFKAELALRLFGTTDLFEIVRSLDAPDKTVHKFNVLESRWKALWESDYAEFKPEMIVSDSLVNNSAEDPMLSSISVLRAVHSVLSGSVSLSMPSVELSGRASSLLSSLVAMEHLATLYRPVVELSNDTLKTSMYMN